MANRDFLVICSVSKVVLSAVLDRERSFFLALTFVTMTTVLGLLVALALLLQVLVESAIAVALPVLLAHHAHAVVGHLPVYALLRESAHLVFATLRLLVLLTRLQCVSLNARIHLREQQAEHALTVLPLKVVQVDLVRERLGRVLRRLARRATGHIDGLPVGRSAHRRETCWVRHLLLLLLLEGILFTDLFFDLLESLQEELLNFAALVEHHL